MRKTMSQREARGWKRRALEAEGALSRREGALRHWMTARRHVARLTLIGESNGRAAMASDLGCVLVLEHHSDGTWSVWAVPQNPPPPPEAK